MPPSLSHDFFKVEVIEQYKSEVGVLCYNITMCRYFHGTNKTTKMLLLSVEASNKTFAAETLSLDPVYTSTVFG